jgi:glycosyltransferase involved in cell wall biosynthesis
MLIFTGKTLIDGDKDGLPNVVAESMSCGVPVLAYNIGGIPEIILSNKNGSITSLKNLYL